MTISDFNDHPKQDGGGGPSEGCEEPTAVTGREMVKAGFPSHASEMRNLDSTCFKRNF